MSSNLFYCHDTKPDIAYSNLRTRLHDSSMYKTDDLNDRDFIRPLGLDVSSRALHGPEILSEILQPGPAGSGRAVKFLTKIGPGRAELLPVRAGPGGSGPAVEKVL